MKKSLLLMTAVVLLCSCGGDNGGGGSPDVSDLPEGTGAQLDLATTDSAKKAEIANLVEQIIAGSGNSLGDAESSASVGKSMMQKATSGNNLFTELCSSGSYSKTYQDVILNGHSSGKVSVSGSVSASKASDDNGNIKTSFDGVFTNYSTNVYKNGEYVNLTGTISSDADLTISSGLKIICDFIQYGTKPSQTASGAMNGSNHLVGALSLSGGVGGALAFDITVAASYSSIAGTTNTGDITVSGAATLKSGGATTTCSVGRDSDPDTDIDNYKVTCE